MSSYSQFIESLTRLLGPPTRGKVRDTFTINRQYLLPIVSDRISIFDFVLATEIPGKGEVLNALNIYWKTKMRDRGFSTDLSGSKDWRRVIVPRKIPDVLQLAKRGSLVEKLPMVPVELIGRNVLTGSALAPYRENRMVCGNVLPSGLENGDLLSPPIFTPSTKAKEGHDEHLTSAEVEAQYPGVKDATMKLLTFISFETEARGIMTLDFKGEGAVAENGAFIWGDEIGTPDSCRFCRLSEYNQRAPGTLPPSLDKQFVRQWGIGVGIDKLDPKNPDDRALVRNIPVPQDVVDKTISIYHEIFERITGRTLESFQRDVMEIE